MDSCEAAPVGYVTVAGDCDDDDASRTDDCSTSESGPTGTGCKCDSGGAPGAFWLGLVLALVVRRRQAAAAQVTHEAA